MFDTIVFPLESDFSVWAPSGDKTKILVAWWQILGAKKCLQNLLSLTLLKKIKDVLNTVIKFLCIKSRLKNLM